jgi:hypothetical protein
LKALLGFVYDILVEFAVFGDLALFSDLNCDVWKTIRSFGLDPVRTWNSLVDQLGFFSLVSYSNWALNVLSDLVGLVGNQGFGYYKVNLEVNPG